MQLEEDQNEDEFDGQTSQKAGVGKYHVAKSLKHFQITITIFCSRPGRMEDMERKTFQRPESVTRRIKRWGPLAHL